MINIIKTFTWQVSRLAKQEEKSSEYDKIRKEDELENISRYIPSEGFNDVYHIH